MQPAIDHVYVTVSDFARAEAFFDRFLPIVGFDLALKEHAVEYGFSLYKYHSHSFTFAIVQPGPEAVQPDPNRPGALNHIAFRAPSRAAVKSAFSMAVEAGGVPVQQPQLFTDQCVEYYTCALKAPEGFVVEIIHFDREKYF